MKLLVNFSRIVRPLSAIKNLALLLAAFYLSGETLNFPLFFLGFIWLSFITSSCYVFNSSNDLEIDENNINKRHYGQAVRYFGREKSFFIALILAVAGLIGGFFINAYFFVSLIVILAINFLYSSKITRFKERIVLDVLAGGFLSFSIRFVASWFVFKISAPPFLFLLALIFAKSGGYLLYKEFDREFLNSINVKNSITVLAKNASMPISMFFFVLAVLFFALTCFNGNLFYAPILGFLPRKFLWFLILIIPPLTISYLSAYNIIKADLLTLRRAGFVFWIIAVIIIWLFL